MEVPMKELRHYQAEAKAQLYKAIAKGDNGLMIAHCTGSGKTVLIASIAKDFADQGKKVLCLVRFDHLMDQVKLQLESFGLVPKIEQGARFAPKQSDVVLGSVMTMKKDRLERWAEDHFDVILADECHHTHAGVYKKILEHFKGTLIGFSATPHNDGNAEGFHVLDKIVHKYSLMDAIKDGYAADVEVRRGAVAFNIKECRVTAGDLNQKDLGKIVEQIISPLASAIAKDMKGQTIVFVPTITTSELLATALRALGIKAEHYNSNLSKAHKEKLRQQMNTGEVQVLVNPASLTEGYDLPTVETVVIARPTQSKRLLAQMVGRGTRPKTITEPGQCRVIEFDHGNVKKIVTTEMIFFEYEPDHTLVNRIKKGFKKVSVSKLLRMYEEIINKGLKEFLIGIHTDPDKFMATFETAYSVLEARVPWHHSKAYSDPASDKLREALMREEIYTPEDLTKGKGCDIIHALADLPGKRALWESHKARLREIWQYLNTMAAY